MTHILCRTHIYEFWYLRLRGSAVSENKCLQLVRGNKVRHRGATPAYFPPLCFRIGHQLLWLSRFTGLCVDRRCNPLGYASLNECYESVWLPW